MKNKGVVRSKDEGKKTENNFPWKEILAFLGVIIAAYIGYLGIRLQIEIPIQATQTAEAKLTLAAQTNIAPTLSETATPSAIGIEGLQSNWLSKDCVNSALWFSLDKEQNNNCLSLDNYGIFANNDGLTISSINTSSERIRHGIFTPIEKGTQIRLKLSISNLYTPVNDDLANLSIGIISRSSYNLETDTLLIYQRESPQKGYPIFVKKAERGGFESYLPQNGGYREYAKNTTQEILLDISNANQLTIYIDGSPIIQVAVPFQDKVFWIGYRLSGNCQIDAEISELQIQKK